MNKKIQYRYSLRPSTAFLIQWLTIGLLFNMILLAIIYFVVDPYIKRFSNYKTLNTIIYSVFIFVMFLIFVITTVLINAKRYWLDSKFLENINAYRASKENEKIWYENIIQMKIIKTPVIANSFDFGSIKIKYKQKNKQKIQTLYLWGIKNPHEVYRDIYERTPKDTRKNIDGTFEDLF
ncbi:MAG: hypothetical protein U9O98_06460 [Asgard group archaeon]|nr:hypothetical protein [Asgard group archaeon]